ncbi:SGNH/GDSL hydrolase family protein [Bradyrhizobium sediminis]|uniref:SGNH/GDSL hydrolase family protein n=1 Tax=Bradyrhizobium sediminis TaxID=2840469 RepID=A0A975NL19_9BRAD|nr:SGNH/GDSL hydrolase family protein [Bradyrhizobium sediminis]QWG17062.1 SGNH/GDSL hydrolase family protein [Bradyrhizobium sediminis]
MRAFGTAVLIVLISIFMLEAICGLAYTMTHGRHKPPILGGPPLETPKYKDDYDFDTVAIWTNLEVPRTEGLYAREKIAMPPKDGDYWVFLVGGSTVADVRKPLGDRLSDHIERGLGTIDGRKVRVFNFGVPAYSTFNALSLLAGKLTGLKPDMVIAYDGVNDAHNGALTPPEIWRDNYSETAENFRKRYTVDINLQQSVMERFTSLLHGGSYAMFFATEITQGAAVRAARDPDKFHPNEFSRWWSGLREKVCSAPVGDAKPNPGLSTVAQAKQAAANAYARNIQTMQAATESVGAKFVHVVQPTALNKRKLFPCESFSLRWNEKAHANFRVELMRQYAMLSEAVARVAANQSSGIFIDLASSTDEIDEYLYDDWHHAFATGRLTEIVGGLIARNIREQTK